MLLFFLDDFAYYWFHRISHEVRLFWASHVVHHSSQYFNLSTALRQTWVPMTYFPFWMPIALLGYPPYMILTMQAVSLMYQFWIHTERIGKLPRPIEFVFNTPSHHRVHHGANDIYLDRNYGGILIIWDRLFGTFQGEEEQVRYGLTKNIHTFRPFRVAFHEYQAMWRDVRGGRATGTTGSATCSAARRGDLTTTDAGWRTWTPPAPGGGSPPPTTSLMVDPNSRGRGAG